MAEMRLQLNEVDVVYFPIEIALEHLFSILAAHRSRFQFERELKVA